MNTMRFPKGLLSSPSSTIKVNLICQTPVTAAMDMYNYVENTARKAKDIFGQGK
jgi:hypothetical protein